MALISQSWLRNGVIADNSTGEPVAESDDSPTVGVFTRMRYYLAIERSAVSYLIIVLGVDEKTLALPFRP